MIKNLIKKLFRTQIVGKYVQFILDVNRNENNGNMMTNGEFLIENKYLHNSDVIFDVGANVGNWSEHCITLAPQAQIHAFEPVRKTFDLLSKKNFPKNVILNNIALGDKEEDKTIINYSSDHGLGTLHRRSFLNDNITGTEIVHISTIDSYCVHHKISKIDFLKIDVEGHEYSVLLGAQHMLKNKAIRAIQFEYGQTYIEARTYLKDIYNLFDSNDYTIYKLYPDGPQPMSYTYELENMRYANYFIERNDN